MYNLLYGVGLACLVCMMVAVVGVADDKADTDKQDIVDTAVAAGNFKTLASALAAYPLRRWTPVICPQNLEAELVGKMGNLGDSNVPGR